MRFFYYLSFVVFLGCKKEILQPFAPSKTDTTIQIKFIDTTAKVVDTIEGYKVAINAKQLGTDYWTRGTGMMYDLVLQTFKNPQPNPNSFAYKSNVINCGWTQATTGDFNNDGYVDVFTPGCNDFIHLSFLLYNPKTKTYIDTNLINDKTIKYFDGYFKTVPVYLNSDNYVDLVVISGDSYSNPEVILLSDGSGGYNVINFNIIRQVKSKCCGTANIFTSGGSVGDLNMDGFPELVVTANQFTFIYWGISSPPYFRNDNYTLYAKDEINFPNVTNNGENCAKCSGDVFDVFIKDVNKDNKNDLLFCAVENSKNNQKIALNNGYGGFQNSDVIELPSYNKQIELHDFVYDEQDGGLISMNGGGMENVFSYWNIYKYKFTTPKNYTLDTTSIMFKFPTKQYDGSKSRVLYYDYNKDGVKDISYIDASWGNVSGPFDAQTRSGSIMKYKTVFIREGDKYVERSLYDYDLYAKSLLTILNSRFK